MYTHFKVITLTSTHYNLNNRHEWNRKFMQKIRRLIKRGWFIIKYLKRILKIIGAIVGIFVLLVGIFFWYLSYSSPVNEAGRTFKKSVRSYRNDNLETVDDMYERLGVIHSHFNSPTHNKVQGGEKQTITHLDIETLFGTSHEVIEEVKLSNADTVYQYNYEDLTLNFHEKRGVIDEYVLEDFTETCVSLYCHKQNPYN